jgi:hypothetical protein
MPATRPRGPYPRHDMSQTPSHACIASRYRIIPSYAMHLYGQSPLADESMRAELIIFEYPCMHGGHNHPSQCIHIVRYLRQQQDSQIVIIEGCTPPQYLLATHVMFPDSADPLVEVID